MTKSILSSSIFCNGGTSDLIKVIALLFFISCEILVSNLSTAIYFLLSGANSRIPYPSPLPISNTVPLTNLAASLYAIICLWKITFSDGSRCELLSAVCNIFIMFI